MDVFNGALLGVLEPVECILDDHEPVRVPLGVIFFDQQDVGKFDLLLACPFMETEDGIGISGIF